MVEHSSLEGEKHTRPQLIDAAIDGMRRSLDEHASYLTPKIFKTFEQDLLQAEYGGIGAYVGEDPEDHIFTITRPIYSGPAYRAGLHSDDKIVRIDDWPTITTAGSKPETEIIKRLKGKPGTKVKLYVWRRGLIRR
jgi:carboxyl-terminal processing protease